MRRVGGNRCVKLRVEKVDVDTAVFEFDDGNVGARDTLAFQDELMCGEERMEGGRE